VANCHTGIGLLLSRIGKSGEERAAHQRALAIHEKLAEANPAVTRFQSDVAWSLHNIGAVYNETGQQAKALTSIAGSRRSAAS